MKHFPAKSYGKGFMAALGIVLVLFLLFTAFGRVPDEDNYASDQNAAPVYAGSTGSYFVKAEPQARSVQAPSAVSKNAASYGGIGYGQDEVKVTFTEEIADGALPTDRKIIKEGRAFLETRDFEQSMAAIDEMIAQSGGFIEEKNVRGSSYSANALRHATIVFRVPSQQFEAIMENMGSVGVVTQSSTSGTDITDQYIDYETRLRNLKMQEETLLDILSRAEKLEDVITLESRISDVRYEIESIENKLKNYDRLVQYSRITVELEEVVEITPAAPVARTLGDRLGHAFRTAIESFVDELENFLVWLVYNWILLLLILVLALVVILIVKRRKRKKHAKAAGIVPGSPDDEKPQD
ncbi:DUF4349 domain-containing protein [Thermoclostridium caenicola]|uniref:DUF4349 domain-containing protein n=1 Tax=Thermoclostridium caenicola TaxID=659425 RepID=A0A1M6KGQ4_9FIRM|nr:DUF4349 domain-containing protein [Thermoclostridium caenicola]SHJ58125.1 protein of unknown function [Thermoclostridium caenicola]